jgi:hypothetical protein
MGKIAKKTLKRYRISLMGEWKLMDGENQHEFIGPFTGELTLVEISNPFDPEWENWLVIEGMDKRVGMTKSAWFDRSRCESCSIWIDIEEIE